MGFFFFLNGGTACLFLRHVLTSWAYMQVSERPGELQVGRKNIRLSQKMPCCRLLHNFSECQ